MERFVNLTCLAEIDLELAVDNFKKMTTLEQLQICTYLSNAKRMSPHNRTYSLLYSTLIAE